MKTGNLKNDKMVVVDVELRLYIWRMDLGRRRIPGNDKCGSYSDRRCLLLRRDTPRSF